MNFLSTLLEWLRQWWPAEKVEVWEKAIRFSYFPDDWTYLKFNGSWNPLKWKFCWERTYAHVVEKELLPGVHRRIPWYEDIHNHSVVDDTFKLEVENVTTKDNKAVAYRVVGVYEIFNVRKATVEVHDYEHSLANIALLHAARAIRSRVWEDILANIDQIEDDLKKSVHEEAKAWGIKIKKIGFSSLVEAEMLTRFEVHS